MTKQEPESWYGVKGIMLHAAHGGRGGGLRRRFEEQVILVRARSTAACKKKAIRFFQKAASQSTGAKFIDIVNICSLFEAPKEGAEVYYRMIWSDEPASRIMKQQRHDGRPRSCEKIGWKHAWYNRFDKKRACVNCDQERAGWA